MTIDPKPLGLRRSFGFGDRLGLATPGHVAAVRAAPAGNETQEEFFQFAAPVHALAVQQAGPVLAHQGEDTLVHVQEGLVE